MSQVDTQAVTLEACLPVIEHAHQVMDWRNDPVTRSMSFHREPKRWDSFWPEFEREYFADPQLPPVFALHQGQRVAFLRFRRVPHPLGAARRCCDVSITVAPSCRGQGIGSAALARAADFLRRLGWEDVLAEVRPENQASQALFVRAGYTRLDEIDRSVEDTGEVCRVIRYRLPLREEFFDGRVFIVAEAGSNWRLGSPERDLQMARTLIEVAAEAGADAVKFQTFRPETVYVAEAGSSDYLSQAGLDRPIREIFADLAMPYEMIPFLAEHCRKYGLEFMSSPFSVADFEAVDPHVRVHKIASYEISHLRLLEAAARSGKPVIMSTGASNLEDVAWALEVLRGGGGGPVCLMQCTAKYPAPPASLNLAVIPELAIRFGLPVGLSDHSRDPVAAPAAAVALGAVVIEKHFTLDNRLVGPDHAFAVTPAELKRMVRAVRLVQEMHGPGIKEVLPEEEELYLFARRAIQAIRPISKGETFQEGVNIEVLRPGHQRPGLHPRHLTRIVGRRAQRDIPAGDGVQSTDYD